MRSRFVLALAFAACLDPTEINVTISSDVPCAQLAGTNIYVGTGEVAASVPAAEHCTRGDTVGSIVVLPNASQSGAQIKVVTGTGTTTADQCDSDPAAKGCIVARRSLSFISHARLSLPILMQKSCIDQPCDEKTTCVNGACQPIDKIDFDASAPDASPIVDAAIPDASDASTKTVQWISTNQYSATTTKPPQIMVKANVGDTFVVSILTDNQLTVMPPSGWAAPLLVSDNTTENLFVFIHTLVPNEPPGQFSTNSPALSKRLDMIFSIYRNVQTTGLVSGGVTSNTTAALPTSFATAGAMWLGVYASIGAMSFVGDMRATPRNSALGMWQQDELVQTSGQADALSVTADVGNIASVGVLLSP